MNVYHMIVLKIWIEKIELGKGGKQKSVQNTSGWDWWKELLTDG